MTADYINVRAAINIIYSGVFIDRTATCAVAGEQQRQNILQPYFIKFLPALFFVYRF